jgi:uncharacterized protein (TIGR02996 family)
MTDGDALYAAILADPDEDTPRLIYADWLDENGRPERAEFIRAQVELARVPTLELLAREKILLATHGNAWLAPLKGKGGPLDHGDAHGEFRRGFVEVVWMPAAWFRVKAESLFALAPVRELRVTHTTEGGFHRLMDYPLLGRLSGLDMSDRRFGDAVARLIAWSPFTGGLEVIRLRGCGITDEGADRLADAEFARPLRELDVSHNPIGPAGVAALRARYGDAVRAARMEWTA